jgi:hypothetical protein
MNNLRFSCRKKYRNQIEESGNKNSKTFRVFAYFKI